jgi:hypothetical protein
MPEFVLPEPGEPFQSARIYGRIEQLCVRSYADLLAPHWNASDRAVPTERFDPARFTRGPHARGRDVPAARRDSWRPPGRSLPQRQLAVVIVREHGPPATGGAARRRTRRGIFFGWLAQTAARWRRRLVALYAAARR